MIRKLRWPNHIESVLLTLIAGAINGLWAFKPSHSWNTFALSFCVGSAIAQVGIGIWLEHHKPKEEKPSSPSQQLTPGISPSPNPLSSPIWSLQLSLSQSSPHSPSPSVNLPAPEARSMPVVGFRSWNANARHRLGIGPTWHLSSFNRQYGEWQPGRNIAMCHAHRYSFNGLSTSDIGPHPVPSPECTCGYYVLTDFDKVPFVTIEQYSDGKQIHERPVTTMVGAVVGWGRVVQHGDEGWRAEKAQVIALLDCKVDAEHLRITNEVAQSYGVPVLGRKALELLAKEYGDPLPKLRVANEAP